MKSKRSKACDISKKTKETVYKRDGGLCIICGSRGVPNSHYIRRSQGGLGIEQNIVTMCIDCHNAYDNGNDTERKNRIKEKTKEYLKSKYKNWNEDELFFKKWNIFK